MTIRDILLHLDPSTPNEAETEMALTLTRDHEAHLAALITATSPELPVYGFAGLTGSVIQGFEDHVAQVVEETRTRFTAACDKAGIKTDCRAAKLYEAEVPEAVALHGRHADLLVMRQSHPDKRRTGGSDLVDEVVLDAGRPVLVVPYIGTAQPIGRNVVVGWDGSREAARAMADAMPLIRKADTVHVLVINASKRGSAHGELPGADISTHLARHGLNVQLMVEEATGIDPANLILSRVSDLGADLLVMGAFAHSRLRQSLFGGVTRTILEEMTVPVLLSH